MDTKDPPRAGDIYSLKVGRLYYALQYLRVQHEPEHDYPMFRFRAHVAVFEGAYTKRPTKPQLTRIYRVRSRPKGALLYVMLMDTAPFLPRGLTHIGHAPPTGPWDPAIVFSDTMPIRGKVQQGIEVSPTAALFGYVRDRLAGDQKRQVKAVAAPQFFPDWATSIDAPVIAQAESSIRALEKRLAEGHSAKRALATCVRALNRLDAKHRFVGTPEAEDLFEVLSRKMAASGLDADDVAEIIDDARTW